jgi:hypothetical protein
MTYLAVRPRDDSRNQEELGIDLVQSESEGAVRQTDEAAAQV